MIIDEDKRTELMSYINHAWDILSKEDVFPQKECKYLYIPTWPELYTGTLKAAAYLFLKRDLENIVFLVEQSELPNDIVSYWSKNFLVAWRKIKNLCISKKYKSVSDELLDQLLSVRLISKVKSVAFLWIWPNITSIELTKKIESLFDSDFWIVFLWKVLNSSNNIKNIEKNNIIIHQPFADKPYKLDLWNRWNLYVKVISHYDKEPMLVAHITAKDLWIKWDADYGYMSVVA